MIYNGKLASQEMQVALRERIAALPHPPTLAIISVAEHPSIQSFIRIKRKYAEAIGVTIREYNFKEESDGTALVSFVENLAASNEYDGVIVQLPLPATYNTKRVLDAVPSRLDVDVLSEEANTSFVEAGSPLPTVVGAVKHILEDTHTELSKKQVLVVGRGKLVGLPVATWLRHNHVEPAIVDAQTEPKLRADLLKGADIIISGSGVPHLLKPEDLKTDVVLIDAGTSEQAGVLAGDCDPACADVASIFTPVPGGVGPLTVAYLFHNLITAAEHNR